MQAKIRCSNCGAEITNLNMSWGNRQWLWMLVAFIPLIVYPIWLEYPKGDYTKELSTQLIDKRLCEDRIDVFGQIANSGKHDWKYITIEAELYDSNGTFLDKGSEVIPGTLRPSSTTKFKITFKRPYKELMDPSVKTVLTVAGATSSRY